jgi:hypothetical protein
MKRLAIAAAAAAVMATSSPAQENWNLHDGTHWNVDYVAFPDGRDFCVLMSHSDGAEPVFLLNTSLSVWQIFYTHPTIESKGVPFDIVVEFDFPGIKTWEMALHEDGTTGNIVLGGYIERRGDAAEFLKNMASGSFLTMSHKESGLQLGHWSLDGSARAVLAMAKCIGNL